MALFVVNRYLGESNETNEDGSQSKGVDSLLERIEERKKLRLKKCDENTPGNETEHTKTSDETETDNTTIHKKKRKRESSLELDDSLVVKKGKRSNKEKPINGVSNDVEYEPYDTSILENSSSYLHQDELPQEKRTSSKKKKKKDKGENTLNELDSGKSELENEMKVDNVEQIDDTFNKEDNNVDSKSLQNAIENENIKSEFTIIGGHNFKQRSAVKWILPEWLSKPIEISGSFKDKSSAVKKVESLDNVLIKSLKRNNIKYFFPVQQTVIPWILKETKCSGPGLRFWPRDICVSAPTGSGKTLAFVLPIIQHLRKRLIKRIGALVVVPVQDLAAQVAQVFSQYIVGTGLQVLSVTGKAMPLQQEQKLLVNYKTGYGYESLVDIVVTTPGRLVEHIKETKGFSLRHLKFIVIDEADRVIDNIKNDWLYHLEKHVSSRGVGAVPPLSLDTMNENLPRPQKLLFSATLTQDPEKLKQINLFQPRMFVHKKTVDDVTVKTLEDGQTTSRTNKLMKPAELIEHWIECNVQLKPLALYHILATKNWRGVLCFTHFTDATHKLARLLHYLAKKGGLDLKIEEISSEIKFKDRNRILKEFHAGNIDVLVCSDVYARGIDILELKYVVLYSPPVHTRNYIHQVGRTARAGMQGTALTMLTSSQVKPFQRMIKNTGQSNLSEIAISESELAYLESPYKKALRSLKKETLKENESAKEETIRNKRKNFTKHKNMVKKSGTKKSKSNVDEINKGKKKGIKRKRMKIKKIVN